MTNLLSSLGLFFNPLIAAASLDLSLTFLTILCGSSPASLGSYLLSACDHLALSKPARDRGKKKKKKETYRCSRKGHTVLPRLLPFCAASSWKTTRTR